MTLTLTVPPGEYCIVPSTYESGIEREFLLRVWVDDRWRCDMKDGVQVKVKDYQVSFDNVKPMQVLFSSLFFPRVPNAPIPETQ